MLSHFRTQSKILGNRFNSLSCKHYTLQINDARKGTFIMFRSKVCQIIDPPKVIVGGRRVTHTNLELKELGGIISMIFFLKKFLVGNRFSERFNAGAVLEGILLLLL